MKKSKAPQQLTLIQIGGLQTTAVGIAKFPKDFSFEQGIDGLKQLSRGSSILRWIIGDLLNHIMTKFCQRDPQTGQFKGKEQSERARAIMEATDLSIQTLNDCARISLVFPFGRRSDTVSWSHHAEVATLDSKEQTKWLARCAKENISTRDLRILIAEATGSREPKQPSLFTEINLLKPANEILRSIRQLEEEKPMDKWPLEAVQKVISDFKEPMAELEQFWQRVNRLAAPQ